jgi:hypothetical protein
MMRRLICWLLRRHTNPRMFGVDKLIGRETWVCRDCLKVWNEYNLTGRHHETLQSSVHQRLP